MGYDMLLTTNWDAHPSREHKTKLGPMIVPCLMCLESEQERGEPFFLCVSFFHPAAEKNNNLE